MFKPLSFLIVLALVFGYFLIGCNVGLACLDVLANGAHAENSGEGAMLKFEILTVGLAVILYIAAAFTKQTLSRKPFLGWGLLALAVFPIAMLIEHLGLLPDETAHFIEDIAHLGFLVSAVLLFMQVKKEA